MKKVTIAETTKGTEVHGESCGHLKKRHVVDTFTLSVETLDDIAWEVFCNDLSGGEATIDQAVARLDLYPCVGDLPRDTEPEVVEPEPVDDKAARAAKVLRDGERDVSRRLGF